MTFKQDFAHEFVWSRCWECGRHYAYEETKRHSVNCPYCANGAIRQAREERDKALRSANALRGALTKARRRS